jgi:hypothetical protein
MTHRNSEQAAQVLKTDKRGRVRSTPAQRQAVLEEFDRSGLTGTKFAALAGVNYQTFAGWLSNRRRAGQTAEESEVRDAGAAVSARRSGALQWMEAVVGTSTLVVQWRGGVRLEISSADQVPMAAQLLKALEAKEGWSC